MNSRACHQLFPPRVGQQGGAVWWRGECRAAWLHKRTATPQCAALLPHPKGCLPMEASALSHGLPMVHHWLRRASRIYPHWKTARGGNN